MAGIIALGTIKDKLNEKYLEAKKNSIPPIFVKDGPAKEVMITDKIDIPRLIFRLLGPVGNFQRGRGCYRYNQT